MLERFPVFVVSEKKLFVFIRWQVSQYSDCTDYTRGIRFQAGIFVSSRLDRLRRTT